MRSIRVVDANVILRYLLADHPAHFEQAKDFLEKVRTGNERAYVLEGVLVECVYVLLKVYGVPRTEVADRLSGILRFSGIINEDKAILLESLRLFATKNVDIVDAMVYTTAESRGWEPFSFDADLDRLGP